MRKLEVELVSRSMWPRGRAHRQGLARCKPAEIRFLTCAQADNRFEQHRAGRSSPQATDLPEREHPLAPTMALLTPCPLASLAPYHPATRGAFGHVMRGFHAWDVPQRPSRCACALHTSRQWSGFLLASRVGGEARAETGLPRPPLPPCRPLRAHVPPPGPLRGPPPTPAGQTRFSPLRPPLRRADQRGHAALPSPWPTLSDQRSLADQELSPVRHALCTRGVGTVQGALARRPCGMRHPPQPAPGATGAPCGRIQGMDQGGASPLASGRVVGPERCGPASHPRVDASLAQRDAAHRGTEGWHRPAARPHAPICARISCNIVVHS
jgi:hypothetical protein